ncbi:UGMP family protein [Brevundimonas diminuta]|uniref:tRNA (adenosine(37)-N6)-threonylcarbamoyltransferase complex dimerization subunit type 1 TsaB n=1 Tax=Brevundimonas diminuta TaxID=293 RepID=UPI000B4E75F4|nr:tRNA (adenosine(37)-N6)-threonylcarbamoyltransferase complex dimerization subunit type 1 TsaB [Brevundimonas diminuta]OWR22805.1 tRNA (adenosine(37)-N6)-threonylcarbamoyltransferase complex dimerization subunit type 1 TsaB [Brevundimonas diminuta]WQE45112.1 tRNA (adenosine(37)-N6)-threonylcarbamoyltransferase complex dimerization subunit type 1 TsaB [Brevundimonas diminuta]SPU45154.1 UGMP family protein [Brevundimonas diminuta]SUW17641.1 UGMP family protein [Brevundimonas diminuta]
MKVMVIDTALGACVAGVFTGKADAAPPYALGVRAEVMAKGHQERLGGLARDAAAEAGGFGGIDRIGVTVGPGSFTGLRVGLAFALGLGAALDRPVVGVSTLDALAASVPAKGMVAAVIDARRGQVYARLFRDGAPLGEAEALPLETARDRILAAAGDARSTLIGSGAALLAETFPELAGAVLHPLPAPTPEAVAALTLAADPATSPPQPLYLRAPDATPPSRLPGQPRQPAA